MAKNTVSLGLDGEVSLDLFAQALRNFQSLVAGLSREVSPGTNIRWIVDYLEAGSAQIGVVGVSDVHEDVEQVVEAWEAIGRALETQQPVPYSVNVRRDVERITGMLSSEVEGVRFSTDDELFLVESVDDLPPLTTQPTEVISYGAVTGKIETLAHRAMRFTLYDLLDDKRVDCFLGRGQEDLVDGVWGKLAMVEGRIRRDPRTGRVIAMRDITNVTPFGEPDPDSWGSLAGFAPPRPGSPPPEDTIRRMRDDDA